MAVFHSSSKMSVRNNTGRVDSALRLEEAINALPTRFSYGPKCSLKMGYKPQRWDPARNSAYFTLVKEKKEIYVIIRAKILHHPMIGDRTELSIVFASLFVKLS